MSIKYTYRNQSTATIKAMSSAGRPTACKTRIMVTKPADGIPAAPIDAMVAVILKQLHFKIEFFGATGYETIVNYNFND